MLIGTRTGRGRGTGTAGMTLSTVACPQTI